MIINFEDTRKSQLHASAEEKTRYIITIAEDEEPAIAAAELQEGIVTVMINARTPEEATRLWKQRQAATGRAHI